MQKILERIINILPIPIIIAFALVFIFAWLLKEIRGFESYGNIFKYTTFQLIVFIIFILLISFYGINFILKSHIPKSFDQGEIGILVSNFDGDEKNIVQKHTMESLISDLYNDNKEYENVKVKEVEKLFKDHKEVCSFSIASGAKLCIWGSYIPPSIVHFNISVPNQGRELRTMVTNFPDVKIISNKIIEFLNITPPPQGATYAQKIKFLEKLLNEQTSIGQKYQSEIEKLQEQIDILQIEQIGKNKYESSLAEIRKIELKRKRIVLIIGIDTYASHPSISYAVSDAHALNEQINKIWPYNTNITILTNLQATRRNIMITLETISNQISENDQFWIYFSGHAFTQDDMGYILPYDGQPDQLYSTAISMYEIGNWFKNLKAKQSIMFVDACYSGRIADIYTRSINLLHDYRPIKEEKGYVIITAGGQNDAVIEDPALNHGVFTYYLIKGLDGEADNNKDGLITSNELFAYIQKNVYTTSGSKGFHQQPIMYSHLKYELVLALTKIE